MKTSGLIDIESHTYNLHSFVPNGKKGKMVPSAVAMIKSKNGFENEKQHDRRIETDLLLSRQLITLKLGTKPDMLCWPFGIYNMNDVILAKAVGFEYMIGKLGYCYPSTKIDNVGREIVPGGIKLQQYKELIDPRQVNYIQAIKLELLRVNYHLNNINNFIHCHQHHHR
jgi:hypothetical protein